jgi:3,4-dihydroxy 2-butanone 4-phosphate synthase
MAAISGTGSKSYRAEFVLDGELLSAARALARGTPVLVFDDPGREAETDMVYWAERVTPESVRLLRHEAGGLLCVTVPEELMDKMGLGYQATLLAEVAERHPIVGKLLAGSIAYDRRSAFGLAVNHRRTFTGIPDRDRAMTIRAIGEFVRDSPGLTEPALGERFAAEFMVPGHVPLLHAARGLLKERAGHTELTTSLATMAHLTPSLALMEMLADDGGPLSPEAARERARAKGWPFVYGEEIREAWSRWYG